MGAVKTEVNASLSITIEMNQREVTLYSDGIPTKGRKYTFGLKEGEVADLGKMVDLVKSINKDILGGTPIQIPTNLNPDLPAFLKTLYDGIMGIDVSVNRFNITRQATPEGQTEEMPVEFVLDVSAEATSGLGIDAFKIKRGGFLIERKIVESGETPTPEPGEPKTDEDEQGGKEKGETEEQA